MLTDKQLDKYAELAISVGINLQKGQPVVLRTDVQNAFFAEIVAKKAYELGASNVYTVWSNERIERVRVDNTKQDVLCNIPAYDAQMYQYFVDQGAGFVSILSSDPDNFEGCNSDKLTKYLLSARRSRQALMSATMSNKNRWTIVSVPSQKWAKKIFPDLETSVAVDKLWEAIAHAVRLECDDPVKAGEEHIATMDRRAEYMTKRNFEYIQFKSANGTDLKVGLAEGHIWTSAGEKAQDGVVFTANLPTEEIFTAPHKYKVEGIVKNALPLVDNGAVIDNFSLTFKDGKVVDFTAEKGYDALKGILTTDEGSTRIGEIALIGKKSPIAESGLLYYQTLFDENASCHLALGAAYPTTVEGGNDMNEQQADKIGLNASVVHVDFMIGTKDLEIVGIGFDGSKEQLFVDGEWVI
ncbi:MAG: aminopeptidase [Clostridia bacterium]|nr:aminopeptidase [Clostridia bacterium]